MYVCTHMCNYVALILMFCCHYLGDRYVERTDGVDDYMDFG